MPAREIGCVCFCLVDWLVLVLESTICSCSFELNASVPFSVPCRICRIECSELSSSRLKRYIYVCLYEGGALLLWSSFSVRFLFGISCCKPEVRARAQLFSISSNGLELHCIQFRLSVETREYGLNRAKGNEWKRETVEEKKRNTNFLAKFNWQCLDTRTTTNICAMCIHTWLDVIRVRTKPETLYARDKNTTRNAKAILARTILAILELSRLFIFCVLEWNKIAIANHTMSFGSCLWMCARAKWNSKSTKSHALKRIKWVSYECDSWSLALFVFCSSFFSGAYPLFRPFYFYPTSNSHHQIRVFFHLIVLTFFARSISLKKKTTHTHTSCADSVLGVWLCAYCFDKSFVCKIWRRINQMVFGTSHIDIEKEWKKDGRSSSRGNARERCIVAMPSPQNGNKEHVKLNEWKSLAAATAAVAPLCCTRCLCVAVIALHMLWMEFLFHFGKSNIISRRDGAEAEGFDAHGRALAMARTESDEQDIKSNVRRTCTVGKAMCESE